MLLVLPILVVSLMPGYAFAADAYGDKDTGLQSNNEKVLLTEEEVLESIKKQLKEQDAERFYPMYEERIKEMYNNSSPGVESLIGTNAVAYFPNGGTVYYDSYYGTSAKLLETYLSPAEYRRLTARNDLSRGFVDLVTATLVSKPIPSLGFLMGVASLVNADMMNRIRNAGAAYVSHSWDMDGDATITLPWNDSPYVTYSSGGIATRL